jgi:hypothetical protein
MKPSIGRIVHFIENNHEHRAAIVTGVDGTDVDLTVFHPGVADPGVSVSVPYDVTRSKKISWHWPEGMPGIEKI